MMRNTITRTMATSQITGYRVKIENGVPAVETLPTLTIGGKAKEKDALKALEKAYGKGVTIGSIEISEDVYEISVEDFLKHATKKVSEGSEEVAEELESFEEVSEGSEKVAEETL